MMSDTQLYLINALICALILLVLAAMAIRVAITVIYYRQIEKRKDEILKTLMGLKTKDERYELRNNS
jgi:hypothetical protein